MHHRACRRSDAGRLAERSAEAGITLVEILVAITLLAGALIGTAGELAAYIKQQKVEKTQIAASHIADSWFEYAESQEHAATTETVASGTTTTALPASLTAATTTTVGPVDGVTYTEQTQPYFCANQNVTASSTFSLSQCSKTGSAGPTTTIYATITLSWSIGDVSHDLVETRNLADNTTYKPADTTDPSSNGLTNCTRANTPTGVSLTTSPVTAATYNGSTNPVTGRAYEDGPSGNPTKDASGASIVSSGITITLRETGLANTSDTTQSGFGAATCVPLFWTDSVGTHQVDMHTASSGTGACVINKTNYLTTQCTYSATIPNTAVSLTGLAAPSYDGTVPFCAYLSGTGSCTTSTTTSSTVVVDPFYVNLQPGVSGCSINNGLAITTAGGRLLTSVVVKCTGSNLATNDVIVATYPTGSTPTTATLNLTYSSGATWQATLTGGLGTGVKIKTNATDTFTFAANRASDNEPASASATISVTGT